MNRVELIGRLVAEPELRKTNNGVSVSTFTLAVMKDYAVKEDEPKADFIDCQAWQQNAEYISQYGKKGELWSVEGHIQKRKFESNGQTKFVTEVVVERLSSLNNKKTESEDNFNL